MSLNIFRRNETRQVHQIFCISRTFKNPIKNTLSLFTLGLSGSLGEIRKKDDGL